MLIKGELTISRVYYAEGSHIEIRFRDTDSRTEFATFRIQAKEFAEALTGLGYQSGEIEIRGLDRVGTIGESKEELVPFDLFARLGKPDSIKKALELFEIDGWRARSGDMTNLHNRVHTSEGYAQKVVFFRNVPRPEKP